MPPKVFAFGVFELDSETDERRKCGVRIKLAGQPVQVLKLLLEHAGKLVTRRELQETLWSHETFTDFEHGLNTAIQRIRATLGDSATNPHFIETLPRKGYRFIASVAITGEPASTRPFSPFALVVAVVLAGVALSATVCDHPRELEVRHNLAHEWSRGPRVPDRAMLRVLVGDLLPTAHRNS